MAEKVQVNADKLKVLNAVMEKIEKDFELDDSEGAAYVYSFSKVMSKLFRTS